MKKLLAVMNIMMPAIALAKVDCIMVSWPVKVWRPLVEMTVKA